MTLSVHIRSRKSHARHAKIVAEAARTTLTLAGAQRAELTVVLTSNTEVRELNRRYAGIDAETDVLAFPSGSADPETGLTYLGDVILAVPVAERQAAAAGHSLQDELALLTIHGVLHLLGHDHQDSASRREMEAAQRSALRRMGITLRRPPEAP